MLDRTVKIKKNEKVFTPIFAGYLYVGTSERPNL